MVQWQDIVNNDRLQSSSHEEAKKGINEGKDGVVEKTEDATTKASAKDQHLKSNNDDGEKVENKELEANKEDDLLYRRMLEKLSPRLIYQTASNHHHNRHLRTSIEPSFPMTIGAATIVLLIALAWLLHKKTRHARSRLITEEVNEDATAAEEETPPIELTNLSQEGLTARQPCGGGGGRGRFV